MSSMLTSTIAGSGGLIKGKWKIIRKIGQGAFGEIFSARNVVTSELVAIKFEAVDTKKQVLKIEVAVLKKLQSASCPYVVTLITCGRYNDYNYMVMELLGDNISELRRHQPNGRFSMTTTMKLGFQMLKSTEAVHELGFLHRDIKPSNFAMGLAPSKRQNCFMIDFGLARRYVLPNGEIRAQRDQTGFRGTARYASINSHQSKDLGRRDDLWSLLYVLIEFVKGQLPWRRVKDKDQVGNMKIMYNTPELVKDLPEEFQLFMAHLQSLEYAERPDYDYLHSLLQRMYKAAGGDENTPFDWEATHSSKVQFVRSVPSLYELCFSKLILNIDKYEDLSALPTELKYKILQLVVRINEREIIKSMIPRLLDDQFSELQLTDWTPDVQNGSHGMNGGTHNANHYHEPEDFHVFSQKCSSLKKLLLGPTSDTVLIEFLKSNAGTLEHLQFYGGKSLTTKVVKNIQLCPQLRVLKIVNVDRFTDKHVETIIRCCERLEDLSIIDCRKIKGSLFKSFVSSKKRAFNIQTIDLSLCPLSKRGFRNMVKLASNFKSISFNPLVANYKMSSAEFSKLLQECRNLTTLNLSSYCFDMDTILIELSRVCTKLCSLVLDGNGMTDHGLQHAITNCTNLTDLHFRYGEGVSDSTLQRIARTIPGIKSLTINFWSKFNKLSITEQSLKNLLRSCTNLNELNLRKCLLLTGTCFLDAGFHPHLRKLDVSDCVNLTDYAIKQITGCCPNLTVLDLSNLNSLTSAALEVIASGCPKLEELLLKNCACFSDQNIQALLNALPRLFVHLTRYPNSDLKGIDFEVHNITVQQVFDAYPNTFREKASDRYQRTNSNQNFVGLYNHYPNDGVL